MSPVLTVTVSEEAKQRMKLEAAKKGMSVPDYIRYQCLGEQPGTQMRRGIRAMARTKRKSEERP